MKWCTLIFMWSNSEKKIFERRCAINLCKPQSRDVWLAVAGNPSSGIIVNR